MTARELYNIMSDRGTPIYAKRAILGLIDRLADDKREAEELAAIGSKSKRAKQHMSEDADALFALAQHHNLTNEVQELCDTLRLLILQS